ncbi:hypothetical protein [Nocardia carnea]|uniref:hypothetical protein n=1 Tax=Nocardia carnea TaxID=37328 RepID=UPI00245860FB|nr:hypothetical protein [Nocardia carnea]
MTGEPISDPPDYQSLAGKLLRHLDTCCNELAHEALDMPNPKQIGGDTGKREKWSEWWGTRGSDKRLAAERELSLAKVRILVAADLDPSTPAIMAKYAGATWAELGDAAGITRQAAQNRWKTRIEKYTLDRENAEEERRKNKPYVSPIDEYDPEGKGVAGEATRGRRGPRKRTDKQPPE